MARLACAALANLAVPALANGPEQLDQLEPEAGAWQAEYFSLWGSGEDAQVLELLYGVGDSIALGLELESEWVGSTLEPEELGLVALLTLADPEEDVVGMGAEVEAAFDGDVRLTEIEGRFIAEKITELWWLQGDLIVRHSREDGASGTGLAYGVAISRAVADDIWFGVESSGQLTRFGGNAFLAPSGQHYAGPSLTLEKDIGEDGEIEIGLAYLHRLRGAGPGSRARFFVQFTF
jgi:hypothetical protein